MSRLSQSRIVAASWRGSGTKIAVLTTYLHPLSESHDTWADRMVRLDEKQSPPRRWRRKARGLRPAAKRA